jgi:glycosyltransferase involved in cell wall biosynthesis
VRVAFVLPSYEPRPNGGFKIAYEYASRLARKGHAVEVVHPWAGPGRPSLLGRLKRFRSYPRARRGVPWFRFDPAVEYRLVRRLDPSAVPEADALVATAWHTAGAVAAAAPKRGTGFYLIQNYETFDGAPADVLATWRLPLHKIVIARWLERMSAELGEAARTSYVPNAIDHDEFFQTTPQRDRGHTVGMLWHHWEMKGTPIGLAALEQARESVPSLEAVLFGTARRPDDLPPWATYVRNPRGEELRRLYNRMAIFLHPSLQEGWGLPPAEAMACGCALVAASNEGVLEYADEETARLAPLEDADALADHLVGLLGDDDRRERLAEAGRVAIQEHTWDRAVGRFERVLQDVSGKT